MSNVLVSGASGYLGAWLVRELQERGHTVSGVNRHWLPVPADAPPMPPEKIDCAIHLSWYSSAGNAHPEIQKYCLDAAKVFAGSVRLLCRPSTRFVFASSASVYGDGGDGIFSEADPVNPNCAYTRAKVAAEQHICQELPRRHLIFRFGSLMGLGLTRTKVEVCANAFASEGYTKGKIQVWNPLSWKPLLHVRDAAEILADAVERPNWTGTVNACAFSIRALNVAQMAARITGAEIEIVPDRSGPRSCRLAREKLLAEMPDWRFRFRSVPETIEEFRGYVPSPWDRNTPWLLPAASPSLLERA